MKGDAHEHRDPAASDRQMRWARLDERAMLASVAIDELDDEQVHVGLASMEGDASRTSRSAR
jgi:hypothetical protein